MIQHAEGKGSTKRAGNGTVVIHDANLTLGERMDAVREATAKHMPTASRKRAGPSKAASWTSSRPA